MYSPRNVERQATSDRNWKRYIPTAILVVMVIMCLWPYSHLKSRCYPYPGWADWGCNSQWGRDSINHFLDIPIPEDAENLTIEGKMGLVGQYGIYPKLTFFFHAPPESALQFVEHFCNGVLHEGYDPFNSFDSDKPMDGSVLIRGRSTIHYSRSIDVPSTIRGNRCPRYDQRDPERLWIWLEEIRLDVSNPDEYVVSYHLPFLPNSLVSAEEQYTRARAITPFKDQVRLHITGFSRQAGYVLQYHTVCMETAILAHDYYYSPGFMSAYAGSDVTISVDGIEQPPAEIEERGHTLRPKDSDAPVDKWQYCLEADWSPGVHQMQIEIDPPQGADLNLEWEFTVLD